MLDIAANAGGKLANKSALLPLLLLAAACKPAPDERHFTPGADAERGRAAIERVGCAACHAIPGIDWPNGAVGPSLDGFARQTLIAGRVPNRPEMLAAFVRNAPQVSPGSAMPAMPLSKQESRDVAAYLLALGDD
ncbi:MAG: c-type cytochrome [Pseudomonadota bacterium]|nr:c-type cytochrome [Pseudomonadota bacterium]